MNEWMNQPSVSRTAYLPLKIFNIQSAQISWFFYLHLFAILNHVLLFSEIVTRVSWFNEKNIQSDANNQMSPSCGHNKSPKIPF